MTHHFSESQINEFRQCFNLYASDGFVTNDSQLRYIMRSLGCCPTVPESRNYIKRYENSVDFAKFLEILLHEENKGDPLKEIGAALANMDPRNKGYITSSEFVTLLTKFGERMDAGEVSTTLKRMRIHSDVVPIAKVLQYLAIHTK